MGKADDDEVQLFPPDLDQLVVICSFNDGTKSPNDHANEQLVLPDVFSLIAITDKG